MKNYNKKQINNDGTVVYTLKGEYHRTDGPAIEGANGSKSWWINGQLHRTDGPAIEYADGSKEWWINGAQYSRSEYYHKLKLLNCPEYMK